MKLFYFSQHFAPIFNPDDELYNTKEKRFAYVLSCIRKAKYEEDEKFTQTYIAEQINLSGNRTISEWESAIKLPSSEQLMKLIKILELDSDDGQYLYNLAYGYPQIGEFTDEELTEIRKEFNTDYSNYNAPAYVLDHYLNILDANIVARGLLQSPLKDNSHILELTFDWFSGLISKFSKEDWKNLVPFLIGSFRYQTSHLRHTEQYMRLLYRLGFKLISNFYVEWNKEYNIINMGEEERLITLNGQNFFFKYKDSKRKGILTSRIVYYEPVLKEKPQTNVTKVFISYSHNENDKKVLSELLPHLGRIEKFDGKLIYDEQIKTGDDWDQWIKNELTEYKIIIMLVSASFLDSEYITKIEVDTALKRQQSDGTVIFPIIISDCNWEIEDWLFKAQHLPKNGKTILGDYKQHGDREKIYKEISGYLIDEVKQYHKN